MITDREFEAILADATKRVDGDVKWRAPRGYGPEQEFRVPVRSEPDWPLFVDAWWNPQSGKLSYTLVHRPTGRIVGLDLGRGHRNPDRTEVPAVHKHRWSEQFKTKQAYAPLDITASWDQPVEVWRQFCAEIRIEHTGVLHPPEWQERWLL